jgi:hypothetical protein
MFQDKMLRRSSAAPSPWEKNKLITPGKPSHSLSDWPSTLCYFALEALHSFASFFSETGYPQQ